MILTEIETYIFDMDGTIFMGDRPILGAIETLRDLQEKGKGCFFVTNNTSKSALYYQNKLKGMGLDVSLESIVFPLHGVIKSLKKQKISQITLLGTELAGREFTKAGIDIHSETPELVVIAYDIEMTYDKLCQCIQHIHRGVPYIGTHGDKVCPSPQGDLPDVGTFLTLIEDVTGKKVQQVYGKPDATMVADIIKERGLTGEQVAVVGDRLDTDMLLAENIGANGILVMSGVTQESHLKESSVKPTKVIPSLAHLFE